MSESKGSLLPNHDAQEYLRKQFVLSAKTQGRLGKFFQVSNIRTSGTDKIFDYKDPVDVAYHLETNPSRKLLTKYGWFTEDQSQLPIVLFITYFDIDNNPIAIDEGAIIELSSKVSIDKGALTTTQFTIVEVRTDLELNQCICRVVPTRYDQKENVKVLADEKDPNLENVFLRRGIYYDEGSVINETT